MLNRTSGWSKLAPLMRRFRLLLLRLLYSMSTRGPKRPSNGTFFIFMSFICVTKPSDMEVRRIPISLSIVPWLVMVLTSCNSQRGDGVLVMSCYSIGDLCLHSVLSCPAYLWISHCSTPGIPDDCPACVP